MRTLKALVPLALIAVLTACGGAPSSLFHSAGYYVRGKTVYYLDAFPGDAFTIKGADAKTFKILDTTYARDKHAVYLDGSPLAEADPATFELLDQPDYSKDSGHVFLRDRVLTTDTADFKFLGSGLTEDGAHVYDSGGSVLSDDPAHFKILSDADHYLFVEDASTVRVNGNPIKGADPATFGVDRGAYATDAHRAFYFDQTIPGVNLATLTVLAGPYARDAEHAYWMGKVIPRADPRTFTVLNANFECTADSTHAYYRDLLIKGFDPGTVPQGATVNNCSETSLSY
ncbi:MAG TPA: DKNYY domain-containing protein [Marmoricola sp.]|nr:DKNYY domain-containing protein [Marmoricola sp.]